PDPASPPTASTREAFLPNIQLDAGISTPCSGMPSGGTANANPVSGGPGSTFAVSVSGATSASGLEYQWQSSTDGVSDWTDIGGATLFGASLTAVSTMTTMYYRLRIICTATGDTAYSTVTNFETIPVFNMTNGTATTCGGT